MKSNKILLTVALAGLSVAAIAAPPTRKVLYTLAPNERVDAISFIQEGGKDFYAIKSSDEGTFSLIFNGQWVVSGATGFGDSELSWLNLTEKNGYKISYCNSDGEWFYNINGEVTGPFDEIKGGRDYGFKDGEYLFRQGDYWFIRESNKTRIWDEEVEDITTNKRGDYIRVLRISDYDVQVNGEYVGRNYEQVWGATINERGDWAYNYMVGENCYINFNSKVILRKSYWWYEKEQITENGKLAYEEFDWDGKNTKKTIYFDDKVLGPYLWETVTFYYDMPSFKVTSSGKYMVCEITGYRSGNVYFDVNGKKYGPYPFGYIGYDIADNGNFIFMIGDIVNINGKEYNTKPWYVAGEGGKNDVTIDNNGNYSYNYIDNGTLYKNDNGKIIRVRDYYTYVRDEDKVVNSPDRAHSLIITANYMLLDGMRQPTKVKAITAQWNEAKGAFVWTAQEGREVVVYELKP